MDNTKTIYRLEIKVWHRDVSLRSEVIHFEHESQALKVLDRFKEHYEPDWKLDWAIIKIPLYANANEYTNI